MRQARVGVAVMVVLAAGLLASHAAALKFQLRDDLHANVIAMLTESACYAAATLLAWRNRPAVPFALVIGVGLVLRLSVLPFAPFHSTDIYRYIWDGHVQGEGINPYAFVPADPALAPFRDAAIWPRINRAGYAPTIYPPVAEVIFFLATRISLGVFAMKAVLLAFEAAAVFALIQIMDRLGRPRALLLAYLWCPLPAWEFAGAGHVDAAMLAFVLGAWLAASPRMQKPRAQKRGADARSAEGLGGALLAAAVLVKFLPVILLPALWRRGSLRLPLVFAAVAALAYLPYLGAGAGVFGFLPGYAAEEGLRDGSGFWFLRLLAGVTGLKLAPQLYVAVVGLVLMGLALRTIARDPAPAASPHTFERRLRGGFALAAAGMLALSPAYPWYFAWLVPCLTVAEWTPVLWLGASAPLLYWDNARTTFWMGDVVFGGAVALALIAWLHPWLNAWLTRLNPRPVEEPAP